MTKEQRDRAGNVIECLKEQISPQVNLATLMCAAPSMGSFYGWEDPLGYVMDDAIKLLEELIQQPQLDENGLVPCGCGGKASVSNAEPPFAEEPPYFMVGCTSCGIRTISSTSEERAKNDWNEAHGWRQSPN